LTRNAGEPFGFLNALKPPGMTSTSFGGWVKRTLGAAAVGHWGTLDPAACGVLVLAVGQATRLLPLIAPSYKRYAFELILGVSTDTGDASGKIVSTAHLSEGWQDRLPAIAADLVGPLEQIPPMFSAVKVGGRALYVSARHGQNVARTARPTRVFALRVVATGASSARMVVECEAGMYVRSLCEEIGARLGVPAHMGSLVRTAAGPFGIDSALLPDEIERQAASCLLNPLEVLPGPRIALDAAAAQRFMHGNPIPEENAISAENVAPERSSSAYVLVLHGNRLIGVGSVDAAGALSPRRVFA
jgi:tRNA pseudouridine55 synthase